MQPDTAIKRLEALPALARAGKPVNGLFRLLTHRPLWTEGLKRIKRNKGAGTPGVDGTKVTDLGDAEIEILIQKLMDGTYRPTPVRRVYIPKANGKQRPLGIPTAKDRMVQEVVRSILDLVYEPIFSENSHGFRKGRSCHTALEQISKIWTGVKWIVEVDIKGYFDNIDHSVLLKVMSTRIDDRDFLALISSMLKAGFLEDWKFYNTHSGTPQGGIVSPLLANIYLHELDLKLDELIRNFDLGAHRAKNLGWVRLSYEVHKVRERIKKLDAQGHDEDKAKALKQHDELRLLLLGMPASDPMDPNYRRLRYVRYADDFLIGVIGSREDAKRLMTEVSVFLTNALGLEVSSEKSGIRKSTEGVEFLGYEVAVYSRPQKLKVVKHRDGTRLTRRSMVNRIQLSVPLDKARRFAIKHEYGHYDRFSASHRTNLLHCDDVEIVDVYNSEFRGFANYYALARDVKQKLRKLEFLWQTSLLKTLAAKHSTSVMTIVRRYKVGPSRFTVRAHVNGKNSERNVWRLSDVNLKSIKDNAVDNINGTEWIRNPRTNMAERAAIISCHFCGTNDGPFELHHVNPLRDVKNAKPLKRIQAGRNRKVVAACKSCHNLLHQGKLPDYRDKQRGVESRVQ